MATFLVAFFINIYMVVLIILNIILIVLLISVTLCFFVNKKYKVKKVCVDVNSRRNNIKKEKYKQTEELQSNRVFDGKFITDEEYQQMIKCKKSYNSILLEEIESEYEHLKELNK